MRWDMLDGLRLKFERRSTLARAARGSLGSALASALALHTLASAPAPTLAAETLTRDERAAMLRQARFWGCQYQDIDVEQIASSNLDLIVVDHAIGRSGEAIASPDEVERLKRKPDGSRRLVLAYLSVGEAENYRTYWHASWSKAPPPWLATENPEWPGAYGVRYWDPAWQAIVFANEGSILDLIVRAGFDGAYLDRVDAYMNFERTRLSAANEMINLVAALAARARVRDPGFLIVPQNAEPLLKKEHYRSVIDGAAKESLLYGLRGPDIRNTDQDVAWSLAGLGAAKSAGLPVFAIEYIAKPENIKRASRELANLGFAQFFANRELDRMPVIFGH